MSTYLGRTVISPPTYPPAPDSIEFTFIYPTALTRSIFTGQEQVIDWGAGLSGGWLEISIQMPTLNLSDFDNWVAWLQSLHGPANVFQFSTAFVAAYPILLEGGSPVGPYYWCLKSNSVKYSLTHQRVGGLQFECIQVL